MWCIYALFSALFAALTAVFVKAGVRDIDSDLATAIRTSIVLILVWAIAGYKGGISAVSGFSKTTWMFLILSGIATGLSWLFYFKAIKLGSLSQVAPVDKLSVALTILLSIIFLGESLTLKTAVGAGLIVVGVIVLVV